MANAANSIAATTNGALDEVTQEVKNATAQNATAQNAMDDTTLQTLCRDMFAKTADYLTGELDATTEEYRLLEQMNRATLNKYVAMKEISTDISIAVKNLDDKYNGLQPYLEMIDQVEESVTGLEQAAYKLDAYAKRLEAKFRQIQNR